MALHQERCRETLDPKYKGRAFVFVALGTQRGDDLGGFVGSEFALHGEQFADRGSDAAIPGFEERRSEQVDDPLRVRAECRRLGHRGSLTLLARGVRARCLCVTRIPKKLAAR